MRLFEILLSLTVFISLWRLVLRNPPRWLDFAPVFALAFAGLHLLMEGYRWQMIGLYFLALVLFLLSLPRLLGRAHPERAKRSRTWVVVLLTLLAALLTLVATAPAYLFPIPKLSKPTGPYEVGTFTRMLVDEARKEIYSANPREARRFMIQVWYPAQSVAGIGRAAWMPEAAQVAPAIAGWLDLPEFSLDHLKYVRMPSYTDAPLAQGDDLFPVLLFSHGWGGFRAQTSFLMHELASNGYIVVSLEYPYVSLMTVFPDGTVAQHNPQILSSGGQPEESDRAAWRLAEQWMGDLEYTLAVLNRMNQPGGEFDGRLDMQRIGLMGHSTGGGVTVEFCSRDSRCKAGLGLDTWMGPVSTQTRTGGVAQPFLFLFSELWPSERNNTLFNALKSHSPQAQSLVILGTDHFDFTDLPLLTPLAYQLKLKGPLEGRRVVEIINAYALAFLNQALKGIPAPLLEQPAEAFPEVRY